MTTTVEAMPTIGQESLFRYGLTIDIRDITPELAAQWLKDAAPNRRIRPDFIRQLVSDITTGRWILNGAPIRFDGFGRVVDGQHRLAAIAKSGVTVTSVIIAGITPDAQETIDEGLARKFADVLRMRGEKYYAVLAAATAWVEHYKAGTLSNGRGNRISTTQLAARLAATPELRLGVEWARTAGEDCPLYGSLSALLYVVFGELSREDRSEFLSALATGEALDAEHPVLVLRQALLRAVQKSVNKPHPRVQVAWAIKAWNAFRAGESIKILKWAPWKEEFPVAI